MYKQSDELYEFGAFRVDIDQHTLERVDGVKNGSLPEKAFQTLVVLLRNSGSLVTKEELIRSVWPDTVVEENNLDKCIWAVRHFLGEKPGDQKYIETVRKHGYRFVAEVHRSHRNGKSNGNGNGAEVRSRGHKVSPTLREAVAAPVHESRVAWTRRYLTPVPVLVGVIVLGLVLVGLYVIVRRQAADSNSVALLHGTANADAYRYYLHAVNLMGRVQLPVAQEAVESLEESIRLDPAFALGYAGLARGRVELANLVDDPEPDCEKARSAAAKALVLDPALAEAYQALGILKHQCEWDFAGAEANLQRALVLNPRSDSAHWAQASYLNSIGRSEQAIAEIQQAINLNPTSVAYLVRHATILYCARQYDASIAVLRRAAEIGHLGEANGWLYSNNIQKGDDAQAFEWLIKMETEKPKPDTARIEQLRSAFETAGWKGVREIQLDRELARPVYTKGRFYRLARLSMQLGNIDDAFQYLSMDVQRRDAQLLLLRSDPMFDPLRADPRFAELLKRIGFPTAS